MELLIWFVILGKLNTKDRILRLNIISNLDIECVLCKEHEESIEHLFFTSKYAWEMSSSCLRKWQVDWVMPKDPRSAFESWLEIKLSKSQKRQSCSCFKVVMEGKK